MRAGTVPWKLLLGACGCLRVLRHILSHCPAPAAAAAAATAALPPQIAEAALAAFEGDAPLGCAALELLPKALALLQVPPRLPACPPALPACLPSSVEAGCGAGSAWVTPLAMCCLSLRLPALPACLGCLQAAGRELDGGGGTASGGRRRWTRDLGTDWLLSARICGTLGGSLPHPSTASWVWFTACRQGTCAPALIIPPSFLLLAAACRRLPGHHQPGVPAQVAAARHQPGPGKPARLPTVSRPARLAAAAAAVAATAAPAAASAAPANCS